MDANHGYRTGDRFRRDHGHVVAIPLGGLASSNRRARGPGDKIVSDKCSSRPYACAAGSLALLITA